MTKTDLVRFATFERAPQAIDDLPPLAPSYHQLVSPVRSAIVCARRHLIERQGADGCWVGRQFSDASLPSQLLMLLAYLGREDSALAEQVANAILRDQVADGGWPAMPGGQTDLSISVQAYFALKLAGHKPNRPHMTAARQIIRELGGADQADATTRWFLSLFGQIDYELCRSNASEYASESSAPRRAIELSRGVRELFVAHPAQWPNVSEVISPRASGFLELVRQIISDQPCWDDEAVTLTAVVEEQLRQFIVVDPDRDEARPCLAMLPISDTAIVSRALLRSGTSAERFKPAPRFNWPDASEASIVELAAAVQLIAAHVYSHHVDAALPPEIQLLGDRRFNRPPGGCEQISAAEPEQSQLSAIVKTLLSRQNSDGGWSADFQNRSQSVPAATAIVLDAFTSRGNDSISEAARRGVDYLRTAQRADGSWDSETGVRFVHGTSWAVRGLLAAGVSADDPAVDAGLNWLLVQQHESGGWGEGAPGSTVQDDFVPAAASAIQTAWAISALVAAGRATDDATHLGVQFLVDTQEDDGDWQDAQFTLSDPATAKWYRNDVHSAAESLAAFASWAVAAAEQKATAEPVGLKLCVT